MFAVSLVCPGLLMSGVSRGHEYPCTCVYDVHLNLPVSWLSYHHAPGAAAAHRWVACRVCRREPGAAIQCPPHPPECCYIQWLLPTQRSKPWNPPLLHAALYRPVENHKVEHNKPNVSFGILKTIDTEWRTDHTFIISGLTYFSKAGAEGSEEISPRWGASCPGSM